MKNQICLIGFFLFSIFFCSGCDKNQTTDTIVIKTCVDVPIEEGNITDLKEYEIIDAIVDSLYSDKDIVLIINEAEQPVIPPGDMNDFLEKDSITIVEELLTLYEEKNANSSSWKLLFKSSRLISKEERNCFYTDNDFPCESIQDKYPNSSGFLSFTRPAILDDNKAVVEFLRESCGGGTGYIVLLEKENNTWIIKHQITTIIS